MSKKVERLIADMALLAIVERVFKSPEFSKQTSANAAKRQAELNQPHNSKLAPCTIPVHVNCQTDGINHIQMPTPSGDTFKKLVDEDYSKTIELLSDEQGTFEEVLEAEFKTRLFPQALLAGTKKRLLTAHQSAVEAAEERGFDRGSREANDYHKMHLAWQIKAAEVALLKNMKQKLHDYDDKMFADGGMAKTPDDVYYYDEVFDAELRSRTDEDT